LVANTWDPAWADRHRIAADHLKDLASTPSVTPFLKLQKLR